MACLSAYYARPVDAFEVEWASETFKVRSVRVELEKVVAESGNGGLARRLAGALERYAGDLEIFLGKGLDLTNFHGEVADAVADAVNIEFGGRLGDVSVSGEMRGDGKLYVFLDLGSTVVTAVFDVRFCVWSR